MATTKSTRAAEAQSSPLSTKSLRAIALSDDDLQFIEQRIDEQRRALWRAAAIIQCVAATAMGSRDPVDGTLNGNQAKDIELALMAAHGLIDESTGALEVEVLLRTADAEEVRP